MSKQTINIGASPNDGTGTPLRTSFDYCNLNFTELYTALGGGVGLPGATTQVIFNDGGTNLAGDAGLVFDKTTDKLTIAGNVQAASATITGNLTVQTNALFVNSANNRVGFGTLTPARPVDIVGSFQSSAGWALVGSPSGLGGTTRYIGGAGGTDSWYFNALTGGNHIWAFGESTAMTLSSTGLGVGVTPSYKLDVRGSDNSVIAQFGGTNRQVRFVTAANGGFDNANFIVRHDSSVGGFLWQNNNGSNTLLTIDLSGNVGIGVTPSAWNAAFRGLDISTGGAIAGSSDSVRLFANSAYNTAGNNVYKNTGAAARFDVQGNIYNWNQAGTGTAGTAITFTQAMTLDANGNLKLGTTGGTLPSRLYLSGDATNNWSVGPYTSAATNFYITANNTSGVFLNGTGATAWSAISDERYKDIIEPISNAVSKVASLRAVIGKFKLDPEGTRRSFLIAQDLLAAFPEVVIADNPDKLAVTYTEIIPLLVAAIKELTARVQTLEAK